jgi:hypothetical protein
MIVTDSRYAQICAQAERANELEHQLLERDEKIAYLESYITSQNDSFDEMMKDRAAHDKALLDDAFEPHGFIRNGYYSEYCPDEGNEAFKLYLPLYRRKESE